MSGDEARPTVLSRSAAAEAVLKDAGVEDARREAARLAAWALDVPLARYYAIRDEVFPEDRLPRLERDAIELPGGDWGDYLT